MHTLLKRKLVVGTITVATAAFAGGAYAATQSPNNPRQAFLNDVAKRLNVTPQKLSAAIQGAFVDQLQAAVEAGKLTQAQADAIKQRMQQGGVPPFGPGGSARHPGFTWPATPARWRPPPPISASAPGSCSISLRRVSRSRRSPRSAASRCPA